MGLDKAAADTLSAAKSLGADFSRCAMIGRQCLSVPVDTLARISDVHGTRMGPDQNHPYAEPFFRMLGAETVDSVDVSTFEGASIIHDMNDPIPDEHRERFSLVFDGGTLEHIFNAPVAFRNCMEMLEPDGMFVQVVPGNNFMGHGFWQFSPELLYRIFSPENGFETLGVFVQELPHRWRQIRHGDYYLARDPARLGWRVELRNFWPTNVSVIARKIKPCTPFSSWPQQSDYVRLWAEPAKAVAAGGTALKELIRKVVAPGLERSLRPPLRNKAYARISEADFLRGRLPAA